MIPGANFYAFPSLAVNRNGDVMLGYTHFGTGIYASGAYSMRLASDLRIPWRAR